MRPTRVPLLSPLHPLAATVAVFSSFPRGSGCRPGVAVTHLLQTQKQTLSRQSPARRFPPEGAAGWAHGQQSGVPSTAALAGARAPLQRGGASRVPCVGNPLPAAELHRAGALTAARCWADAQGSGWGSRVLPLGCSSRGGGYICGEPAPVPSSKRPFDQVLSMAARALTPAAVNLHPHGQAVLPRCGAAPLCWLRGTARLGAARGCVWGCLLRASFKNHTHTPQALPCFAYGEIWGWNLHGTC